MAQLILVRPTHAHEIMTQFSYANPRLCNQNPTGENNVGVRCVLAIIIFFLLGHRCFFVPSPLFLADNERYMCSRSLLFATSRYPIGCASLQSYHSQQEQAEKSRSTATTTVLDSPM